MRLLVLGVVSFAAGGSPLQGQDPTEYREATESTHWVSDNPFRLFLVRGTDTIPNPVRSISVFRESWTSSGSGFEVERASVDVGLSTEAQTDTFSVSRRGEVLLINGSTNYNEGEWDAFLRLPAAELGVGVEWSDTLSHPTDGPHGTGLFEVRRRYRVSREIDSLGVVGFEVVSDGEVNFELSMWTDSTAGHYRWFDLTGPMEERFVFDPASGQLMARSWSMLLEGIGGDYDGLNSDTVPAGLRSANERYRIPSDRARALMAPLPGADSSVTVRADGAPLFLHTYGRELGRVVEGLKRADGLVGTAQVEMEAALPARWTFRWVDLTSDEREATYEARGDGLMGPGGELLEPPAPNWAVAEHGMFGSLVPSLEYLGEVEAAPLAIYRPTPARWDQVDLTTRTFDAFRLSLLASPSGTQTAVLFNADGILLYEEVTNADGSRSVRVPTSPDRQAELQEALSRLQAR